MTLPNFQGSHNCFERVTQGFKKGELNVFMAGVSSELKSVIGSTVQIGDRIYVSLEHVNGIKLPCNEVEEKQT